MTDKIFGSDLKFDPDYEFEAFNDVPDLFFHQQMLLCMHFGTEEFKHVNGILRTVKLGLWKQHAGQVCLSKLWFELMELENNSIMSFENYLALIDDPEERQDIFLSREELFRGRINARWDKRIQLRERNVWSFAFRYDADLVLGADLFLPIGVLPGRD